MTDKIDGKWSTPPLKASWFEDGEEPADNALKTTQAKSMPAAWSGGRAEQMTVQDFFDLLATDETPTG